MATFTTPQQSWDWAVQRFGGDRSRLGLPSLGPFRRCVVERLAESDWGRRLWASQTHDRLVVAHFEHHSKRHTRPLVIVVPLDVTARIGRYAPFRGCIGEVELPLEACWPEVEAALHWMEAADA